MTEVDIEGVLTCGVHGRGQCSHIMERHAAAAVISWPVYYVSCRLFDMRHEHWPIHIFDNMLPETIMKAIDKGQVHFQSLD